jgi:hypothetical protein
MPIGILPYIIKHFHDEHGSCFVAFVIAVVLGSGLTLGHLLLLFWRMI